MQLNRVVARFRDSTILKGKTSDFSPNKTRFHLETLNGNIVNIDMEQLKAVFFVKDCNGDKNRRDDYNNAVAGGGRKIKVKFSDGELVIGYSLGYSPDRHGFFMTPADPQSNNARIFVITSAIEKLELL